MTINELIILVNIITIILLFMLKLKHILLPLVIGFTIYGFGFLFVAIVMEIGILNQNLYMFYYLLYTFLINFFVILVRFFKQQENVSIATTITMNSLDKKTKRQLIVLLSVITLWLYLLLADNFLLEWVIDVQRNISIFIVILNLAILGISLFFIRERISFQTHKERTYMLEKEQELLNTYVEQIKSQKHDFNLHLTTINGLLSLNRIEESKRYVDNMIQEADIINQTLIFSVPEISALLFNFENSCQKKDVTLILALSSDLKNLPVSYYHFNKILGNLLTNALEEAEKQKDKRVMLIVEDLNEYYEIIVKNTGFIDLNQINSLLLAGTSTKGKTRGHGLTIVKNWVEKAKGTILISLENEFVCFSIKLPKRWDLYDS